MADRVIITPEPDRLSVRRTAWSAVFAGALVALMTTFLLSLLAAGIGFQNIDPASEPNTFAGFGTGGLVALIATNLIALFLGGWVTGYLAGLPHRGDALMHGVLTWAVLTVLTIVLLTTAVGRFIGGAASLVGGTLSSLTQGAAAAAPDSPQGVTDALAQLPGADALRSQVDGFLEQAGVQNPEQAGQELAQLVSMRLQAGESLTSPDAREELTTFLTQNSELTEAEIDQQVQEFSEQLEQAQQEVAEGAEQAAGVSGLAAISAFVVLLIGAFIAALGAAVGTPKRA